MATKAAPRRVRRSEVAAPARLEVSIVMPCLNEAETLAACIQDAQRALEDLGLRGEVVVADNGSTDGSAVITREPTVIFIACTAARVDAGNR